MEEKHKNLKLCHDTVKASITSESESLSQDIYCGHLLLDLDVKMSITG